MKKINHQPGPRGINLADGTTFWVERGQEIEITAKDKDGKTHVVVDDDKREIKGDLPDFGKPSDQADRDASEVEALRARVAELEAAAKPPAK